MQVNLFFSYRQKIITGVFPVDNVDNSVNNSVLQGFSTFFAVDNFKSCQDGVE